MGWLTDDGGIALCFQLFQRLRYCVDLDAIAFTQLFNNHFAGEGTADGVFREGAAEVLLNGADGFLPSLCCLLYTSRCV